MYKGLILGENEQDDAQDAAGYNGTFFRTPVNLMPIDKEQFRILFDKRKVQELFFTIQGIDRDHNGYVTQTELDDILKMIIPSLRDKNLKPIYLPFVSSANKVLVDYKRFKAFLI